MKRNLLVGVGCASLALSLAVIGCEKSEDKAAPPAAPAAATPAGAQPAAGAPAMPAMPGMGGMGGMQPPPPTPTPPPVTEATPFEAEGLTWTVPAGWSIKPGAGMRFVTFVPPSGPELTVIRLNGEGGGLLMNINRWRGQLMLPPLDDTTLPANTTARDIGGFKVVTTDIKGPQGRILGAVIPAGGATWFLKAQGASADAVEPMAPGFEAIVASTKAKG